MSPFGFLYAIFSLYIAYIMIEPHTFMGFLGVLFLSFILDIILVLVVAMFRGRPRY